MSCSFCQYRHGRTEQQSEDDQNSDRIKSVVVCISGCGAINRNRARQLVHGNWCCQSVLLAVYICTRLTNRDNEEDEYDECDEYVDHFVDACRAV